MVAAAETNCVIRLIDDVELLERFQEILEAETDLLIAKRASDWRKWIKAQPEASFISSTGAASILKIQPPHVARYRRKGRIEPLFVEGGHPVYLREKVEDLALELAAERGKRQKVGSED